MRLHLMLALGLLAATPALAEDPDLHELRKQPIYRRIRAKLRQMKVRVR